MMCAVSGAPENADWLSTLLALSTLEEQSSFLHSAGLLNSAGLSSLLDEAMLLARSDPGKAQLLATICETTAREEAIQKIPPRATYVRAQAHAINGELVTALELIQSAKAGYEAIEENLEALRTNLGLMHVLNEMGRHHEALVAGYAVIDALDSQAGQSQQANMITALAYSNLGVCYETMGRYEEALGAYDIAETRFAALQLADRISEVSNNRGIVLMHMGRVSEALTAFDKASRNMEQVGLTLLQAQTLSNMGEALLMLGDYTGSLSTYEKARRLFERLEAQANKGILLRKTGDAYLALNLFPEALSLYQQANDILHHAGMADHQARASWGMGTAHISQGQYGEAASALHKAEKLFESAGNIPMLSSVLLEESALHAARGHRETALEVAHRALALVGEESWPVQRVYACLRMADLSLPDTGTAEAYLLEAQRLASSLNLPPIGYRLESRYGRLRLLQQRHQEAQFYLESALDKIESLRGSLAHESLRVSFLHDKTTVYEDLLRLHLDRDDADSLARAFVIAEQAKSRTLVDLLSGVITAHPVEAQDPALAAELDRLQAELSATYNQFLEISSEDAGARLSEMQARALRLEKEISHLRLRAAGLEKKTDIFQAAISMQDLQEHMPPHVVLLAYHVLDDEVLAFILYQREIVLVRRVSRISRLQELVMRLNAQWERFRVGSEFVNRHMQALENTTQRILAALYAELFAPLSKWIQPETPSRDGQPMGLVIVPHGLLHQVPFHALFTGQRYLLDMFEISYALSGTIFVLCQQRVKADTRRALVMANPHPLIPSAEAEARAVAKQLAEADLEPNLELGEQALRASLKTKVANCDVLHLACHGIFRSDNPLFSSLNLYDGWLTAADVSQLRLNGALVTLSACETGRSRVISGDEVIGLPRAFLGAGANTVLVSLWLVPDKTTTTFMTDFYSQIGNGLSPVSALRAAQLAVKEHYTHPFFWAPFSLIGQR